jgi:small subunit ribosomal protein S14
MRIEREKKIRREYIGEKMNKIVGQMVRSVTGEGENRKVKKDYRNICTETGRARGIVREYGISRLEYRRRGDKGELEGVRRAS